MRHNRGTGTGALNGELRWYGEVKEMRFTATDVKRRGIQSL